MEDRFNEFKNFVEKYDQNSASLLQNNKSNKKLEVSSSTFPSKSNEKDSSFVVSINSESDEKILYMKDFHEKLDIILNFFNDIESNIQFIKNIRKKFIQTAELDTEKDLSHDLKKVVETTNKLIFSCKTAFETLKMQTEANSSIDSLKTENSIRNNLISTHTRRLKDLILDYQSTQKEYTEETKNKMKRQICFVFPEANESEIDTMIQEGDFSAGQVLKNRMQMPHQTLRNAVADISDKYKDVQKLEKSVVELNQLFIDLATIIHDQGEVITQIEKNVLTAESVTHAANADLVKARKTQVNVKKRMCFLTTMLAFIAAIIILVVFLS